MDLPSAPSRYVGVIRRVNHNTDRALTVEKAATL
jgi:hypothetical protein